MNVRDSSSAPSSAANGLPASGAAAYPVLGHRSTNAIFAWRAGHAVTVAQFLSDAERLAAQLPQATHLINGCHDAYLFAVGMLAAMLRGQISVLPHNLVRQTQIDLAADFPGACLLIDRVDDERPPQAPPLLLCPTGHAPVRELPIPSFDASRIVAVLFTSGSTGRAQAQPRRWGTIALSARAEAERLGLSADQPCAVVGTGPSQHSYHFESSIWLPMMAGGQIVAEHPFYPADVFSELARLPMPRILVTSPVHLRAMLGSSLTPPPATIVMSATAPLPLPMAADAERQFDAQVIEIYGSTETGQVASRRPTVDERWQTLPGVRIEQRDGATFARDGHVGEPTELADQIDLIDPQRFRLLGRRTDLVKVAGKRGSLREIEQHLLNVPGVVDAAVLASDDEHDAAARLTGFVVAPTLDAAAIVASLRDRLDPAFIPRPLYFVERLPRDGNGKLPKLQLQALASEQTARRGKRSAATAGSTGSPAAGSDSSPGASVSASGAASGSAGQASPPDAVAPATDSAAASIQLMTPAEGPMYDGHFPGLPIVPGARLLDLIASALGLSGGFDVPSAKFVEPVGPATPLTLSWQRDSQGRIAFDCRTLDARRIAHGTLRPQ